MSKDINMNKSNWQYLMAVLVITLLSGSTGIASDSASQRASRGD